jgi:hypothetical protein
MAFSDQSNPMSEFNGNDPVLAADIAEFEKETDFRLPTEYIQYLQICDGGEGFIGPNAYVIFWRLRELLEMNKAYQAKEYAPELFLFGSDGGGEAFAFDTRDTAMPIVSVPFIGLELQLAKPMGTSFNDFVEQLAGS